MAEITMIKNELLGEVVYKKVHESGLEMYFIPKKDYQKKFAYFATRYGALYNDFIIPGEDKVTSMPHGIAHFLEHKIFEDKEKNIFEEFAKLGANVNAFTNFQSTAYMFSTVDNFYKSLELLLDFVQNPHLTDENVEKEKGIIEQEIKMYDDDSDWNVYFNLLKGLYHNHPMRHDIAGTVESVKSTTREQLQRCYDLFYSPKNMMVFVIGDLDAEEVFKSVEDSLTEEYLGRTVTPSIHIMDEPKEVNEKNIEANFEVALPLFSLGFKDYKQYENTKARLKKSMAIKIALDMMVGRGSDFYTKNYEAGSINASFSYEYSFGRTFSYSVIGGESKDPENVKKIVLEEIAKYKESGFVEEEFTRIKKKMIGRYLSSFNSIQYVANTFISYYMKDVNLFEYLEILNEVDLEYITREVREHFEEKFSTLSIVKEN